jgi:hypothetical protein
MVVKAQQVQREAQPVLQAHRAREAPQEVLVSKGLLAHKELREQTAA